MTTPPKPPTPGARVAALNWRSVQARLAQGAVAVLPVGAASKQHGHHLPMNTDYLQAEWLTDALVQRAAVLVWPTLGYGHYPAFTEYPGSVSLSAATFSELVSEILADLRRAGARACMVLNTGISTIEPLRRACRRSLDDCPWRLVNVYDGPRYRAAEASLLEQARGGHADEAETSMLMVIAPDVVDMNQAESCTAHPIQGRLRRIDTGHNNYSPSGVYGDPRLANPSKGAALLAAMLEDVLAVSAELSDSSHG